MNERWISVTEIAQRIGRSRPTVYKYLKEGKIDGLITHLGTDKVERSLFEAWCSSDHPLPGTKAEVPHNPEPVIYFLEVQHGEKHIKIGRVQAGGLAARLSGIRTGCPYEITLIATVKGGKDEEAALHKKFKADRLRGEWFRRSEKLAKYLESLKT